MKGTTQLKIKLSRYVLLPDLVPEVLSRVNKLFGLQEGLNGVNR